MPLLLVVHHTPSPATRAMLEAVLEGAGADGLEDVEVETVPALAAGPTQLLRADAVVLGTPANIGYMSGALKHFLDLVYYPAMDATAGLPYGLYVHGNDDTTGARRSVEKVVGGLDWSLASEVVEVVGEPDASDRDALWNLGATVAAATLPA